MAQFIDFIVDGRIFLDIRIRRGNIGFRLIEVIIADKVADFIIGKEGFKFAAQLGCQGLVVSDDQGRFLDGFDELGHGEGLPGTGSPDEDLGPLAGTDAFRQGGDGLGLIAHWFIRGDDVKGMRRIVIFIVMGHIHKRYLFLGPFFQFL